MYTHTIIKFHKTRYLKKQFLKKDNYFRLPKIRTTLMIHQKPH